MVVANHFRHFHSTLIMKKRIINLFCGILHKITKLADSQITIKLYTWVQISFPLIMNDLDAVKVILEVHSLFLSAKVRQWFSNRTEILTCQWSDFFVLQLILQALTHSLNYILMYCLFWWHNLGYLRRIGSNNHRLVHLCNIINVVYMSAFLEQKFQSRIDRLLIICWFWPMSKFCLHFKESGFTNLTSKQFFQTIKSPKHIR